MAFQGDSIYWVETEKVVPNPFQPRREFDEHKLKELADSIRMYGVLQPLTVTRHEIQRDDGTFYTEYELIAGERRLRATKLAGVAQVPVIIREGEESEQEKLELAIIENLQREDLNSVDRALAFKQLAEQFGLSHVQVAQKVGRSREYVSNSIRLLALPENILDSLRRGEVSEGLARTLLMLNDRPEEQQVVFEEAKLKKLSVRDVERISRRIATEKVRKKTNDDFNVELIELEKQFTETLGTRVQIQKTEFGGRLAIDYFTVEDLEAILERMNAQAANGANPVAEAKSVLASLQASTPVETGTTNPSPAVVEPAAATEERTSASEETESQSPMPTAEIDNLAAVNPVPAPEIAKTSEVTPVPDVSIETSEQPEEEKELQNMRSILAGLTSNLATKQEDATTATPEPVEESPELDSPISTPDTPIEQAVEPASQQENTTTTDDDADDSDLYAINRFTV